MENQVNQQRNKIFHLEDSMVVCGIYNSDTFTKLIDTVHKMHNKRTWNLTKEAVQHYTIYSLLYITTMREKYVRMYEKVISQLLMYVTAIRVPSKGYLPISLLPPMK